MAKRRRLNDAMDAMRRRTGLCGAPNPFCFFADPRPVVGSDNLAQQPSGLTRRYMPNLPHRARWFPKRPASIKTIVRARPAACGLRSTAPFLTLREKFKCHGPSIHMRQVLS